MIFPNHDIESALKTHMHSMWVFKVIPEHAVEITVAKP